MKGKIFVASLVLFILNPLVAQACSLGDPKTLAYILRDNNRCEGLQDYRDSSSTFDLISFSTSNLNDYPDRLNILVPGTGETNPIIEIVSFIKNYRLNNLETQHNSSGFAFSLDTTVLRRADIPISSLRSIAYIMRDSSLVYFPVILGQSSSSYVFIIYSPQRTTFPIFEVRHNGTAVYKKPLDTPREGQIRFTWEYQGTPAGNYELYIVNEQGQSRTFRFQHNPNWL